MKILNLYAGIGGNRHLWGNDIKVTAIENNPMIAEEYERKFPNDKIIVADAHEYLKNNYMHFDFIWSSPPCPTHSRMRLNHKVKVFPDMKLYQEIIFLKHFCKNKNWIVENVIPYYDALIKPTVTLQRHHFWSNFPISEKKFGGCNVGKATKETLSEYHNIELPMCKDQRKLLRNCVNPEVGKHIINSALELEKAKANLGDTKDE